MKGLRIYLPGKHGRAGALMRYPAKEDYPVPSCLILGFTGKKPIHVCASIMDGYIQLITAYYPAAEKWDEDWKTRKEETE